MNALSCAQVAPTANDMAMNALIFGYAGHSLVTPHAAIKQLWWTNERIEAKVTKRFVISKLRGEEREFLRHRLIHAGDLTDRTYVDCILDNAKRLFLILAEIGASDQIFGCIDDGWTDDDLPIALEDTPSLELSYKTDRALNQRFYRTQFKFLLRTITPGSHIIYGPQEHVPIDMVNTLPPAVSLQAWDRVHFPGAPDEVFVRRVFAPLVGENTLDFHAQCLKDIKEAQKLAHQHIASIWASYEADGATHTLSDFVPEHTLRSFMEHRTPMQFVRLAPERRTVVLCEWMHCLADAMTYLHHNEVAHGGIRPSNITIDHDNRIAFADIGTLSTFQLGKKTVKHESRDYSAPEVAQTVSNTAPRTSTSNSSRFSFRNLRKLSIGSASSSASVSSGGYDSAYGSNDTSRPNSIDGPYELPADIISLSSFADDVWSSKSVPLLRQAVQCTRQLRSEPPVSLRSFVRSQPTQSISDSWSVSMQTVMKPEMSDIYSLGCIFLDIVTFVLRGKLNDFIKFRSSKVRASDGKIKMNTSFQANPAKLEAWMGILEDESWRYSEAIYRGVPDLLRLVRRMLDQDPTLRPSASHVRDRVSDILALTCGIESLCCADPFWTTTAYDCSPRNGEAPMSCSASGNRLQMRHS